MPALRVVGQSQAYLQAEAAITASGHQPFITDFPRLQPLSQRWQERRRLEATGSGIAHIILLPRLLPQLISELR
jgi:hypothetical protein